MLFLARCYEGHALAGRETVADVVWCLVRGACGGECRFESDIGDMYLSGRAEVREGVDDEDNDALNLPESLHHADPYMLASAVI